MSNLPNPPKFTTYEGIYKYLLHLEPGGPEYLILKRFVADLVYEKYLKESKKLYEQSGLTLDLSIDEATVKNEWENVIKNIESKDFEVERRLLELGRSIIKIKNLYFGSKDLPKGKHIHKTISLLDQVEKEAEKLKVKEYIEDYIQPIKQAIENHEYVYIGEGGINFHAGLFIYQLELRIYLLRENSSNEDLEKMAETMYESLGLGERIKWVIQKTGADKIKDQKKVESVIKNLNKEIDEKLIERIEKEQVEYFELLMFFKELRERKGDLPFTDDEIKKEGGSIKKKFERIKELHEKFKTTLPDDHKKAYDRMLEEVEHKFKRPYGFVSFVEREGKIYAVIPEGKKGEFIKYIRDELMKRFSDEGIVNRFVDGISTGGTGWKWNEVEREVSKIIEQMACLVDKEITKERAKQLTDFAKKFDGNSEEGIELAKEIDIMLNKLQNKTYFSLKGELEDLYGAYLSLIERTIDKIIEEKIHPKQKYEKAKHLEFYLHNFDGGRYEYIKYKLDSAKVGLARDMLASLGETRVIKSKVKFWSGMGTGIAGLTVFGFGVLSMPWIAPFGIAFLPIGIKLIKDGLSDLKEKHDEFVRKKGKGMNGKNETMLDTQKA